MDRLTSGDVQFAREAEHLESQLATSTNTLTSVVETGVVLTQQLVQLGPGLIARVDFGQIGAGEQLVAKLLERLPVGAEARVHLTQRVVATTQLVGQRVARQLGGHGSSQAGDAGVELARELLLAVVVCPSTRLVVKRQCSGRSKELIARAATLSRYAFELWVIKRMFIIHTSGDSE